MTRRKFTCEGGAIGAAIGLQRPGGGEELGRRSQLRALLAGEARVQPIAPNALDRQFTAARPNQKLVTDITSNACAENFWATLKTELVQREHYATREEARRSIFEYIEVFYNRQRLHSGLGYQSPEMFEAGLN